MLHHRMRDNMLRGLRFIIQSIIIFAAQ